jgi:hypothetical protein
MMSTKTPELSADEARSFQHFSVHNAAQAQQACPDSMCEAYRDIFTYRRWRAQGYQVLKGQSGTPSPPGSQPRGSMRMASR